MRALRPIAIAVVLAAAIYYVVSLRPGALPHPWTSSGKLELTEASAQTSFDPEEQVNINVYKKALPSVVNITSTAVAFDFFYGVVPEQGQGSGFVIDKAGHILTNYHVVQSASADLEVTLSDKKKYKAKIIGLDRDHDLAVLQIEAPNLTPAVLGNSHTLEVGQKVFAIGNPFGLAGTMTRGIISSIRPVRGPNGNYMDEAIQTDAAINPGNSGGPLLNSRGEVIGMNTFIVSQAGQSSGIGFAIPINAAKAVLNDLVTYGQVRRPALGVRTLPIGPELAEQLGLPQDYGLLIMNVVPGSAAAKAGLRGGTQRALLGNIPILIGGDLIVAIDGRDVQDQQDLAHVLNNHRAGDTVTVTFYRGRQKMNVKVTLGEAPQQAMGI